MNIHDLFIEIVKEWCNFGLYNPDNATILDNVVYEVITLTRGFLAITDK